MDVDILVKLLFIDLSVQVDEKDGSNIFDDSVFGKFQNLRGKIIIITILATFQGGRGHWAVCYYSPQSFILAQPLWIEFRLVGSSS